MLLRKLGPFVVISLLSAVVWGQDTSKLPNWSDLAKDAASACGNPQGFGALSRLPSVRIVVYDPVANAFGFIRCTADGRIGADDPNSAFNQDYLDRERLALTTQKIRLLILPYNSRTTHLTLVKTNGHGVEFKALFSTPASADTKQADDTKSAADQAKTPPANTESAGVPKQKNAASQSAANTNWLSMKSTIQLRLQSKLTPLDTIIARQNASSGNGNAESLTEGAALNTEAASLVASTKGPRDVLAAVSAFIDEYRNRVVPVESSIDSVRTGTHCLHDSLAITEGKVTRKLADVDKKGASSSDGSFSLAYDRTLADVIDEAQARRKAIIEAVNESPAACFKGVAKGTPFDDQVRRLDDALDGSNEGLNQIGILLDKAADGLTTVRNDQPGDVKPEDWKATVDGYGETLKNLKAFHTSVQKRIDDARTAADALLEPHEAMVKALEGPAAWIQRIPYPPLEDGQSLNLAFQRTAADSKATTPATVDEANSIELRSASSDALRFSTGVVKSGFQNPTFKAGPTEPKLDSSGNPLLDSSGKPVTQHQILFDDESNGTTLMGVFVHHYWERRSPLLRPTRWERIVPTLSLGLPLSKSDPLDQVLLGLDWELIPGVELNVGGHFGKSARLVQNFDGKPLHVGDYVPATVDSSAVQSKHYSSGLYFGISLNGDAFAALTGSRK